MGHQNDFAALYSELSTWQRDIGMELINEARPRPGEVVLDIGCGTGGLSTILARRVGPRGKVMGLEPRASRLALARAMAPQDLHNVSYVEGRAEELAWLTSNSVDLAYSNFAFHWVADKRSLAKEVLRALRPGGRFVFQTGGGLSQPFVEVLKGAGSSGQALLGKLCFLTDREWRALLVKEGIPGDKGHGGDAPHRVRERGGSSSIGWRPAPMVTSGAAASPPISVSTFKRLLLRASSPACLRCRWWPTRRSRAERSQGLHHRSLRRRCPRRSCMPGISADIGSSSSPRGSNKPLPQSLSTSQLQR